MKLICKIDHISLPVGLGRILLTQGQTVEVEDAEGYKLLALYPSALAGSQENKPVNTQIPAPEPMTKKVIESIEKVK